MRRRCSGRPSGIGTIRNSNFGFLFDVKTAPAESRKAADSNAYFAGALAPHTDLATRGIRARPAISALS